MAINRRAFLQALGFGTACTLSPLSFSQTDRTCILGACRLSKTQYGVSKVDTNGKLLWQFPLPARGHDIAVHINENMAVSIARRPGQFIILFDVNTGQQLQRLDVSEHYKLNGHAIWLGEQLIVSASETETSQMVLFSYRLESGVLKLESQKRYGYFGPHELIAMKGEIAIAVGGLKTDGRTVLNKDDFESVVLKLNADTFEINTVIELPTKHVSFRHIAADENDQLYISGQYQLDPSNSEPLLFVWKNDSLYEVDVPSVLWRRLKGYIGSISVLGNRFFATSPRAHWMGAFSSTTLSLEHQMLSNDICALTPSSIGLIAGTGTGKLWVNDSPIQSSVIWDNHFVAVGG